MSDNRKCRVCGRLENEHVGALDPAFGKIYVHVTEQRVGPCPQFQANDTACTVDPQQCDAECQARPDRACATEPKSEESVYAAGRDALACEGWTIAARHQLALLLAINAGEAAEKRAEEAEERARRSYQDRYDALNVKSRDGLLSSEWLLRTGVAERERDEAIKRAESAERERDELKRWRDETVDIAICRQQFPDGSVPGNTVECAEGWFKIAHDELRRVRELERERDASRKALAEIQAAQMKPPTASEYWGMDYCSKRADRAERERDEARARADKLEQVLLSRHGGEPISLLEELDQARAKVEILKRELDELKTRST